MMRANWTTKSLGFFLLIASAIFIIALMVFTNNGLRTTVDARIADCNARLEQLESDAQYAKSHGATEEETKRINNNIAFYTERLNMLQKRETVYAVTMSFLMGLLLLGAFLQSTKTASFRKASLIPHEETTYHYYHFLSAPLCAVCLLLAIGVTYRSVISWAFFDLVQLVLAVAVGGASFLLYRKSPYISARLSRRRLGIGKLTHADVLFFVPVLGIFALLAANFLFGVDVNGAKLWIRVAGFTLQPGEIIKVLLVVLFASSYGKMWRAITAFVVDGITIVCLLALRDMGAAMVVFVMLVIMLFLLLDNKMTLPLCEHRKLLVIILVCAVCLFFVVLSLFPYALERFSNAGGAMENPAQSQQADMLKALVFGGLGGLGLENSSYILNIFAIENDMAIAGLTAVFGYGMLLIVLLCYALLVVLPLRKHAVYREFYFASAQISAVLVSQVTLNALGAVDVLPFTGIVAPFISDGGSALMAFCAMAGILLATLHPVIKPLEVNG